MCKNKIFKILRKIVSKKMMRKVKEFSMIIIKLKKHVKNKNKKTKTVLLKLRYKV